jgi:hypothetical protein
MIVPMGGKGLAAQEAASAATVEAWAAVGASPLPGLGFFDAGGTSVGAVRLLARLEEAGWSAQLLDVFQAADAAELAALVVRSPTVADGRTAPPAAHAPTFYQEERLLLEERAEREGTAIPTDHIAFAFDLDGPLDVGALEQALATVGRAHPSLRTSFARVDGEWRLVDHSLAPTLDVRSLRADDDLDERIVECLDVSFDVRRLPLFRATLLVLPAERSVLLFVAHHLLADAWSVGILLRDLGRTYASLRQRMDAVRIAPTRSFTGFAWRERQSCRGPAVADRLAYWRRTLGEDGLYPALPLDLLPPRPESLSSAGAGAAIRLDDEAVEGLAAMERRNRLPLSVAALASLRLALDAHSTDDRPVVVELADINRPPGYDDVVGLFFDLVPVVLPARRGSTVTEVVRDAAEALSAAHAHRLPWFYLARELAPTHYANPRIPPQLFLNVLDDRALPPRQLELEGVVARRRELPALAASPGIEFAVVRTAGGVLLDLAYEADWLTPEQAEGLLEAWRGAVSLVAAAERSEERVGSRA